MTIGGTLAIDARNLWRTVRLPGGSRLDILRGADLRVKRGQSLAIVGRSGSGKTTLLSTLGLLTPVERGQLHLAGHDVGGMGERQRVQFRNRYLGFVFQSYSLVPHLSARRNVELPLAYRQARGTARERRQLASEALHAVGLSDRAQSRPQALSGGEQQRVAIARAIVNGPAVLLADEPTGALDVDTAASVLELLSGACEQRGCTLVVVTHDSVVASLMSRQVELIAGTLQERR